MNKIITINLAGQAIAIDEKAYEVLNKYLASLERHFSKSSNTDEIMEDIEARIAEMFNLKFKSGHTFIDRKAVDEAIAVMGNPSDMDEGIDEEHYSEYQENRGSQSTSKKLYRSADDKILGGVCAGVAAYFNLDPSLVRIATLLLFFFGGLSFLPYLILWIILPEARTPQEKYRMHGVMPDIDDIAKRVRTEAENVAQNIKSNKTINKVASQGREVFRTLFRSLGKIGGALVLIVLVVICAAVVSHFVMNLVNPGFLFGAGYGIHFSDLPEGNWMSMLLYISLMAIILIPIGTLLFLLICFVFGIPVSKFNLKALFAIWLIFVALCVCMAVLVNLGEGLQELNIKLFEGETI